MALTSKMSDIDFLWKNVEQKRCLSEPSGGEAFVVATSLPVDNKAGEVILKKFLAVLGGNFKKVSLVISGTAPCLSDLPPWITLHQTGTQEREVKGLCNKMARQLLSQLIMSRLLCSLRINRSYVFFWNAGVLFLPHIVARSRGAKSIYFQFGDVRIEPKRKYPGLKGIFVSSILGWLQAGNQLICSSLAVENMALVEKCKSLSKHKNKTVELSLFIDIDLFRRRLDISQRQIDFLFLGRLTPGKGVVQILRAVRDLQSVDRKCPSLRIIGSGPMQDFVKKELSDLPTVSFLPWVGYDTVGEHLNHARILLLPSDTEGLPNVIIEAMACGTVPMATSVGGIPGIVLPGKTGFLLKDNQPETIARMASKALHSDELENFSKNAANFVTKNYSYEAAVERMKKNLGLV